MASKRRLSVLMVVFTTCFMSWGCTLIPPTTPWVTPHAVVEETLTLMPTETRGSIKTLTPETVVAKTTTPVPPGVFVLVIYPPLIMNYDTSVWKLVKMGSLQALSLETCQLAEVGPSGNFPSDVETVQLGNVEYLFSLSEISTLGMTGALYIENQSLNYFDYTTGLPVLMILASQSDWEECKTLGEKVLSTLHSP